MKYTLRSMLLFLISCSGAAWMYRTLMQRHGPLVRVLCFHDVPDRAWFESVIGEMVSKYHLITPEQFHRKEFHPEKINILLSFDDGYQSWVDVVLPVLEQHNILALFFVTSGLLDATEEGNEAVAHFVRDRLHLTRTYRTLTWGGVEQLVAAGHTIGGHTRTHASLGQLADVSDIEAEVIEDKTRLETKLNIVLTDFAFPFGRKKDISSAALEVVGSVYQYYYSAHTGFVTAQRICPRTLYDQIKKPHDIQKIVEGAYDILIATKP